ncbi:MAG: hypothetical protein KBC38_02010 [Candidatus Pacebacteria bacterium]|nr:hypothetical protein [Candidatus Paceibacterota bacterium]MBP9840065.1 hypothetical protein [Candidatus Paceibacterota bacterium]
MMDFTTFNLLESGFWLLCAVSVLMLARRGHPAQNVSRVAAVCFVAFALSDIAEVSLDRSFFEPGLEWLLIWKGICILILIFCVVAYIRRRI